MKKYPKELFYIGNTELLKRKKISIIGSRSANQYSKQLTYELASKLSQVGVCIVSGGALGIDAIAHKAAGTDNTIMVAGTGLDKRYPALNKNMIEDIETKGLVISQFNVGTPSQRYNFPIRNEVVVSLGEVLIVAYADFKSGSMRSVDNALKMGKDIYVFPHRLGESMGTNHLHKMGNAKVIFDIDEFVYKFGGVKENSSNDEYLSYFKTNPSYDKAVEKYSEKVFEYELNGIIKVSNSKIFII